MRRKTTMMTLVIGHWSLVVRVSDLIRHSGFGFLVFSLLLASCTGNPQSRQQLDAGKQALDARQYDQAIRNADTVLAGRDSPALAEAYYLRGYAIEQRPKEDNAAAARDLAMAHDSYTRGLNCNPRPVLAARLHTQLGNVCYYQEDYAAAVRELAIAYAQPDAQSKDLILYHIGIGQQRLGRFDDADRSFQHLQQDYSNSPYCAGARVHQGIRGFYVQVGAYSRQADIDKAASAIAAAGSVPLKTTSKGLTIVRTADVPEFGQAEQLKARLAGQYPDARIMP